VKFNGTSATVTSWNATTIAVTVPTGATTGNVVVFASGVNSNGKSFAVVSAPSITGLSITTGAVGAAVTLTGTNFGTTQGSGTVKFNGTSATVTSWNATTIAVTVPTGATTGNVVVFASGVNSNGKSFTVLPTPNVTNLSATSGTVGTPVTITGTNFGSTQGTSTVSFNGTTASATSWSATSIATAVPSGATTGNVIVTVSGIASNGSSFTVTTLVSIAITPVNSAIGPGNAQQFTATGTYSDNSTQNLTATATWTSSATAVATINSSGLASAVAAGATTIQASVGAIQGSTLLTIPGFTLTGTLQTARNGQTATLLTNGTVLVVAGYDGNGNALASAELYNPTLGTFTATGSLNTARTNHTATLLSDGTVLIAGGFDSGANLLASAEIYNPATGIFTLTGSMATPRANFTATRLGNGLVLVAGSYDSSGNVSSGAELYNQATDSFLAVGNLNTARGYQTAALLNDGTVLIVGGLANGSASPSAELYNPISEAFVPTGNLVTGRFWNTTTLLNNGQVLVAGGKDINFNVLSTAELYNPTTNTFTATIGSLNTARGNDAATLLNNGMVLIEGGFGTAVDMLANAELYDPVAGTFSATGNLNVARQIQTATLLPSGLVLVAAGFNDSPPALNSAELYQPSTLIPANLVSIALSPLAPSIPANTAQGFTASGTFSDNSVETLASATWSSSNSSVATISNDSSNRGVALGVAVGSATLSACAGSVCGSTIAKVVTPEPTIATLSPNSGPIGASVTISGTGFGVIQGTSTVTFNQTVAIVTSWSPTTIVAIVPNDTTGNVVVKVGGVASNLIEFAILPTPVISQVSPASGDVGSTIQISGANFCDTQGTSTVTLNGTALTVTSWSTTSISGTVAAGSTTGNVVVNVAGVASNPVAYTLVNVPSVFGLAPPLGPVGTSVTISGADFGAAQGSSTVTFNGIAAGITAWNSTAITTTVPIGAVTGPVIVNVAGTPSNGVVFVTPGSPNISSLNPTAGLAGTTVVITGTDFGATQGTSTVIFNGTLASPTSWQPTQIVVTVPTGATSGNVTVTASGVTGAAAYFAVAGPVVSSLSRTSGEAGSEIAIYGSNFGATQGTSTVTFNGTPATIATNGWINTGIIALVPSGATTGNLIVSVNGASANAGTFTVYPTPVISSISAPSGLVGSQLTVNGTNFGTTPGTVGISGGNSVTPTSWNNTTIVFNVPTGGYGPFGGTVFVNTSLGVGENGGNQPYFLVLPSVTNLSQSSGTVGTSIQINGYGFEPNGTPGTLTFNGTLASPTSWSPTQIVANPPVGATTGNIVVTVNGNSSVGVNFTVQAGPTITSLSRTDGIVTTPVTISGTGFGTTQGTSTVTFNGTAATPTAWNGTAITVPVPSGAATGLVVVTVSGAASNGITFTLDGQPSIGSLSQTSGSVGTPITIYGSNFLDAQGTSTVKFNGTSATPTSWSADAIGVNVPSGTTTGNIVVTVLGQASAGASFSVTATPTITSLSPTSGPAGTLLTINGSSFGSSQGASLVTLNGVSVVPAAWASGKITAPVPEGTTTGAVVVTVNNGPSNGSTFTVTTGPGITSVSPTSGGIGATVTVAGAGFGASQGTSTLKFNGTLTTPASWSDTSITVPVPSGATTGNIVATVAGAASNGAAFTVSSTLSVSAVIPNSGNTGTTVTITGTGFGTTQGSSKVTFSGVAAAISTWSNTSITTSVPAAATSGPVLVVVGAASSDGFYFAAQPLIDSFYPNPAAIGGETITITGQNFGATQGSSVVTCNGNAPDYVSWSSTSIVVDECVLNNGSTSGIVIPVQITVNGVTSNVASIQGIPDPSLASVSPRNYAAVGTPLLIRGQNLGAMQGQSSITFNGVTMTPTSWSSTGIVAPVPSGVGTGGFVSVTVGGLTASSPGPLVGTLPTPTSLQITPAGVNMLVGDTKQFVAMDNQGLIRYDATWTVDNPSLGSITTGSSPTLTALASGTVTLTATVQSVSAQMPVTISTLASFPAGTVLWSTPPVAGYSSSQIAQAVTTEFGPDIYFVQGSSTQTLVQAFTSDGQQTWQAQLPALAGPAAPDGVGGLIVTEACNPANPSGIPMNVVDLDGVTGAQTWETTITSSSNACPPSPPKTAVRQDGLVVIAGPLQISPALVFLGAALQAPAIPPSTITDEFGTVSMCDCYTPVGQPIVDSDGSIYLEYEVRQVTASPAAVSSILWLMNITPDGSVTTTQLSSSDNSNLYPGTIIPDGTGGVLTTWTISPSNPPIPLNPYQAAYVVGGAVTVTYSLPFTPENMVIAANGLPINPVLVLGENGSAFATDGKSTGDSTNLNEGPKIVSFNLYSGAVSWTYQVAPQFSLSIICSADSNGLGAKMTDQNGVDTILRFDSGGGLTSDAWSGSGIDYFIADEWLGFPAAGAGGFAYSASPILGGTSVWPRSGQKLTNEATKPVKVRVTAITEAGASSSLITTRVNNGIKYWQNQGILVTWDSTIQQMPACPATEPNCAVLSNPASLYDIANVTLQNYFFPRFPIFTGFDVIFTHDTGGTSSALGGAVPVGTNPDGTLKFSNKLTFRGDLAEDIVAHEIGHGFQLQHVGNFLSSSRSNLMCGSTGTWNWFEQFIVCDSTQAINLTADQITQAKRSAMQLVQNP